MADDVDADIDLLIGFGFNVRIVHRSTSGVRASIRAGSAQVDLRWAFGSEFRFFPALAHRRFGRLLHPIDVATAKPISAASAPNPVDAFDLLYVDDTIQPLGAVTWAAAEREPGWTAQELLANLHWRSRCRDYDLADAGLLNECKASDLDFALRARIYRAERLVRALPRSLEFGALLRADRSLAQPDPDRSETFEGLVVHHGSRKGAWPSSPEIGSVMLRERS